MATNPPDKQRLARPADPVRRPVAVLIAEDDDGVRRLLRDALESEGYDIHEARNGRETLNAIERQSFDLVTLDLGLDRDDGLAVTRAIRLRSAVPIIIISGKASDIDRIVGLEVGADDYIVKPFNPREVLARIRAVLRRADPLRGVDPDGPRQIFAFSEFHFDSAALQLTRKSGEAVTLTAREIKLLEIFVRRPGRVLSRETLLSLLGDDDADILDRAIDSLVARLRRKLETHGNTAFIKTLRGAGYLFVPRVETVA